MEHLDVLIVGAGLSGIGAGALPRRPSARGPATPSSRPATPSAARGTCSATPASAPTPTCSRSATRSGRGTARSRSPTATSILQYIKDTAAETGIDEHIRFHHRIVARRLVDRRRPLARHRRAHRHRRDRRAHLPASSSPAAATTATTRATSPTSPAWTASPGTIVHPQPWPEDLDYAGKRVVVIGSGATAVTLIPSLAETAAHVTMLQRSPTYIASLPAKNPIAHAAAPGPARRGWPAPAIRWFNAAHAPRASTSSASAGPALVKRLLRKGVERQLPKGYDIDTHFTPTLRPVGPAPVRRAQRRPVQGDQGRARRRSSPTTSTPSPRRASCSQSGDRARGRHHRHRHRARAAVHRRHRAVGRRRAGRPRRASSPTRG